MSARHGSGPPYKVGADTLHLDGRVLREPLSWKRPRRIFPCSMTDLFHEDVPEAVIAAVFGIMAATPWHQYLVLTKRIKRALSILRAWGEHPEAATERWDEEASAQVRACYLYDKHPGFPLPNVGIGVSAENQETYWDRWYDLCCCPAAWRWLSLEPLLGGIDLLNIDHDVYRSRPDSPALIHWVVPGGESAGPPERSLVERCPGTHVSFLGMKPTTCGFLHPKPEALAWVRSLRDQCLSKGTAFFFKQWGGPQPWSGGRFLDGVQWNQHPALPGREAQHGTGSAPSRAGGEPQRK